MLMWPVLITRLTVAVTLSGAIGISCSPVTSMPTVACSPVSHWPFWFWSAM